MKFPSIDRWISLPVVVILFLAFLVSTIYTLSLNLRSDRTLNQKANRIAELVTTTSADNLANYDLPSLKKSAESFFTNKDIASVRITDNSGNKLINFSRPERGTRKFSVTRKIVKNEQYLGTLTLVMTNYSAWENAEKQSNLIIDLNLDNIWDYNIEALTNSIDSFFKDKNIESIMIRETSGDTLLQRERRTIGTERLKVWKKILRDGTEIGSIEIVFSNHTQEASKREHSAMMAALIVVLAILMTIAFIVLQRKTNAAGVVEETADILIPQASWSVSSLTEDKLKKAINYIENNYNREISREGLASMLDINPDNLGRYFKLYTGEKINDYINKLRIESAARMLKETEDTIVNIAFNVGFENISTFNRVFWRIRRETPTDFRKKKKKILHNS